MQEIDLAQHQAASPIVERVLLGLVQRRSPWSSGQVGTLDAAKYKYVIFVLFNKLSL